MKKRIIAAVCAMSVLGQIAAAAEIKPNSVGQIEISGSVGAADSREVLISIFGPYDSLTEYADAAKAENMGALYVNAVYADDTNRYSFAYTPKEQNKFYAVSVTENGKQETMPVLLAAEEVYQGVLESINSAKTLADMQAVFKKAEYKDVLIGSYPEYQALTAAQQDCVMNELLAKKGNAGFVDFKAFEAAYTIATAVQTVNNLKDAQKIQAVSEAHFDLSSTQLYMVYQKFTAAEQITVFQRLIERDFAGLDAYMDVFDESIFLAQIEKEPYATNLTALLQDNAARLGLNLGNYTTYAPAVNTTLRGKYYKTLPEFQAALTAAVYAAQRNPGTPSGGSGGGGGSQHGSSTIIPNGTPNNSDVTTPETPLFSDLDSVAWAKDAIITLAEKRIVSGKEAGKFYPQDNITREEFVKIIVGAFAIEDTTEAPGFTDVDAKQWYYGAVAAGVKAGIISGISKTEFGVGQNITRQDMAAILYRVAVLKGMELPAGDTLFIDDAAIAGYAKDAVYALKEAGVVSGVGENCFEPKRVATRAEAVQLIYTMMEVQS